MDDINFYYPYFNFEGLFDNKSSYTMVSENVAIGDYCSSYEPFDVIVNMNYPYHKEKLYSIGKKYYEEEKKTVYTIGIKDSDDMYPFMKDLFENFLPNLLQEVGDRKILFHCYAGVSRSSTMAIAFLHKKFNIPVKNIFFHIKERRSQVNPNNGFSQALLEL